MIVPVALHANDVEAKKTQGSLSLNSTCQRAHRLSLESLQGEGEPHFDIWTGALVLGVIFCQSALEHVAKSLKKIQACIQKLKSKNDASRKVRTT